MVISSTQSLDLLVYGRRSRTQRLTLAQKKEQLLRTMKGAPEVMVKVSGGGKTEAHVAAHMDYITRNGQLDAINQDGDVVSGKQEVSDLLDTWEIIDKGEGKGKKAFNVVLSMPTGTNPEKLLHSVQDFAREELWGKHQYIMVLHTQETDPSKKPSPNPHVHLIIKAEGEKNRKARLYIRKATLEHWRIQFAEKLRENGIEANATPRDIRGKTRKPKSMGVYKTEKSGKSVVLHSKIDEAKQEILKGGLQEKPWDNRIKEKRKNIVGLFVDAVKELRAVGDNELADIAEKYARNLPKLETERHAIIGAIVQKSENKNPVKSIERDIER